MASTSSAAATRCPRPAVARRNASFTVSLIVLVPNSARAAASVSSSRSIKVLRHQLSIYNAARVYLLLDGMEADSGPKASGCNRTWVAVGG